jgi:hypothetical protein
VNSTSRLIIAFTLLSFTALFVPTTPATAITAELANKCRALAIKANPPQRIGAKAGTAGNERKYYSDCVANGGSTPDEKTQSPPSAAPAKAK